jgi:streptogramin lyase
VERLIPPTPLRGSNGIAFGPDGRLYVAEYLAGRISAVDVATGVVETVIAPDGPIESPDDLAFDITGAMYVTDLAPGRVWRRTPAGELDLVAAGIRNPNGIACAGNRVFVNEMVPDGRLLEVGAGEPTVLAEGLMMGNAMQFGPDGLLYYPHMFPGEVYRIDPDGGAPELVAGDVPQTVAVRFDRDGVLVVLSLDEAGTVTRFDGGRRTTFTLGIPGLDNAAFDAANRMFVSSFAVGGLTEVRRDGTTRQLLPRGLAGPYGLAVDAAGALHVADHYRLDDTFLPFAHGLAADGGELHFTSQYGQALTFDPGSRSARARAESLDQPRGLAVRADGALVIAEAGAGRVLAVGPGGTTEVLAEGLGRPADVALDAAGRCHVSDEERGAVYRLDDGGPVTLAEGLDTPQGLVVVDGRPVVVEAGRRRIVATGPPLRVVAGDLPIAPPRHTLPALFAEGLPGVPRPFAALTTGPDGSLYLAGTADGSVLRLPYTS